MTSARARHRFDDHTGEVRLSVEAPTLAALFEEAGLALAELMLDESGEPSPEAQKVSLDAVDRSALLVQWLNELIFLSETHKRVYTEIRVEVVSDTHLDATVRGVFPEVLRTAVKAATFHEVRVEQEPDGRFWARVVLDV